MNNVEESDCGGVEQNLCDLLGIDIEAKALEIIRNDENMKGRICEGK